MRTTLDGGVEVGTATPNIVVDQPLEAHLETPTVVDRAIAALGDAGGEARATAMLAQLDATADPADAAMLAYELAELYERRLADEARAVKAYGRALALDPSLRPNLWAIRRVFYRRGLWPNLVKLIDAELAYARDDDERADLLLEKARVAGHHMNDVGEARAALDEAVRIAPHHQSALLQLERVVAQAGDLPALLDTWELLAEAVEHPARKISYWIEVGRAAASPDAGHDVARAQAAFDRAAELATAAADRAAGERVAREQLRVAGRTARPPTSRARSTRSSRTCSPTAGTRPRVTSRAASPPPPSWSRCAAARPSSRAPPTRPSRRGRCCSRRSRCRPASRSCSPI